MLKAPRHRFITEYYARIGSKERKLHADDPDWQALLLEVSYQTEEAIALRKGGDSWTWTSSCSSPAIVCAMLESLDVAKGMSVLELGTGSGWNAALLSVLSGCSGRVRSIEMQPDVAEDARRHLRAAGFSEVEVRTGDGVHGLSDGAPYDRIIVTAASRDIAPAWFEQLAPEGRLLVPFEIPGLVSPLLLIERNRDGMRARFTGHAEFMHMLGAEAALSAMTPQNDHGLTKLMRLVPRVYPVPWTSEEGARDWSLRLSLLFYLHLADPRAVAVQLEGGHWDAYAGLWDRDKEGLALIGPAQTIGYGDPTVYDELLEHCACWTELGRPGIADYEFRPLSVGDTLGPGEVGAISRKSIVLAGRIVSRRA